jgi:hypothetical protein
MARWGFWDWVAYACLGIAALGLAAGTAMHEQPTLWDKLPSFFTDPKWGYVPIVLFALGSLILAIRYVAPLVGKPSIQTRAATEQSTTLTEEQSAALTGGAPTTPLEGPKQIVDVTPEELATLYKDHLTAQAERLAEPYIGKWMKISGQLWNLHKSSGGNSILVIRGPGSGFWPILFLNFMPEWESRVEVLRRDQNVSVVGKIDRISEDSLHLRDCELLEFSPRPD